ncbi:mitochondrial distribution and morphology protein 12 [Emergomyces pasteurianus Ep9510]|uniref:Mitochondrial distribution and morphology protein 12 n=1 Tax=Emergomyces pasteurianus Ep9510 TaxID=1447872 RepID=A0A1J9PVH8_9EURO|nr:mitochondrial distribution and morphology protein 12 [Emergomyces pasteurianus Ep9510]
MSIDIDWDRATSGPDGELLAERIRSFIHDKFQQIVLPRFIRSVQVTSFDFGTIPPELEIRDLSDPFPDFYEEDDDEALSESSEEQSPAREPVDRYERKVDSWRPNSPGSHEDQMHDRMGLNQTLRMSAGEERTGIRPLRSPINFGDINPYLFPRSGTPGIPGGTSNLGYYMPLSGLSGSQTPLGAVARGNPFSSGWPESPFRNERARDIHGVRPSGRRSEVEPDSPQSRPSTANTGNTLFSRSSLSNTDSRQFHPSHAIPGSDRGQAHESNVPPAVPGTPPDDTPPRRMREQKAEDFQVFCRTKYVGDISLSLTAEILLDYPMPSFVGLPLKLNITGLTFDAVAVIAYIRRRIHFCFLSPEDADTLIGPEPGSSGGDTLDPNSPRRKHISLLREIKVESEIGRKENGKQALKNVGKVEKFVLEQVRRLFEEEFVYPSFWTFLV